MKIQLVILILVSFMFVACEQGSDPNDQHEPTLTPTENSKTSTNCDSMCDHALGCVAENMGMTFAEMRAAHAYKPAKNNCVSSCTQNMSQSDIECWSRVPCSQIESEQGLARKTCPAS